MTVMVTTRAAASGGEDSSASRAALVETLRAADGPLTVQELADALGLHKNSVRFHLARLIRRGLVLEAQATPTGPGRPRLVYSAAGPSGKAVPSGHQLLAEALAERLVRSEPHPDDAAIEAGVEQGRRLMADHPAAGDATVDEAKSLITELMGDYGFSPRWDPDGERLWLGTCPFAPLSDEQPAIACSVHLGLMRGALDAAAVPLEVVSLDAATSPHPCLAVFSTRAGRRDEPDRPDPAP